MKFISTKELRTNLPNVRKNLALGEDFLLIHQSKPIGKIMPVHDLFTQAQDEDIQDAAIKDLDGDCLTKKELDYYLSLK